MSTLNIVLGIVFALVVIYIVYILYRKDHSKEHFTTQEESSYDARLETMKIFELVLNRKPTTDEITKYSQFQNEQDILVQVLQDYKSVGPVIEEIAMPSASPDMTSVAHAKANTETFQASDSIQKVVADLQLKLNELKTLVNVSA